MTENEEILTLAKIVQELLIKLQTMQGVVIEFLDSGSIMYSSTAMTRIINVLNSIDAVKIQKQLERIQHESTGS